MSEINPDTVDAREGLAVGEYAIYPKQEIADLRRQLAEAQQAREHDWTGCQQGGDPAEVGSYEWVRYCKRCGIEDTCEDPLPPCITDAEAKLAKLPGDWDKDSSLETWFPLAAEELERTKAELAAANALLRRAQAWIPNTCERTNELLAAITAHLEPDTEKTAQDWLQHRFTQAYPDELVRPRLVVIGPQEKLESIRLSVDNPAIPNLSGVRAWIEDAEGQG